MSLFVSLSLSCLSTSLSPLPDPVGGDPHRFRLQVVGGEAELVHRALKVVVHERVVEVRSELALQLIRDGDDLLILLILQVEEEHECACVRQVCVRV